MNQQEIMATQQEILRGVFGLPQLVITRETSAKDVDEWDSMTHLKVVAAIEKHFKVRFRLGELQALKNVGDMADLIERKLSGP